MTRRQFASSIARGSAAAGALMLSGCFSRAQPPLRVGAIVWPGYEPLFLARKLGFLDRHPIKLVEYSGTPEAIRAFCNGVIEAIAVTSDEFLRLSARIPDLRGFLITDISHGADAILARPEFDSLASLRGRRVGVEVNAVGVYMLTRSLAQAGMSPSDVTIVPVELDQQTVAFEEGELDALVCFDPNRGRLVRGGARILFDSSQIPGEIVDFLACRQSVLHARTRHFQALAEAWFAACDYCQAHPDRAAELMSPRCGVSPRELLASIQLLKIPSVEENRAMLRPGGPLEPTLEEVHRVVCQSSNVPAVHSFAALLTPEVLP